MHVKEYFHFIITALINEKFCLNKNLHKKSNMILIVNGKFIITFVVLQFKYILGKIDDKDFSFHLFITVFSSQNQRIAFHHFAWFKLFITA